MRKIAISLSKGGVGKTTTAAHLATGLAREGRRVLLIDADTQGQAAVVLGMKTASGLADVLTESATLGDAVVEARPNLHILAGGRRLAGAKRDIGRREFGGEQAIVEALMPLEDHYDYAILDSAPGWDALSVAVLFFADEVLCPVSMEVLSIQSLVEFRTSLAAIQRYRERLALRHVLPTFVDGRVRKTEEILSQLKRHFTAELADPIRYSVRLSECGGHGQTIWEYAPDSTGAKDYDNLVKRILGDEQKADARHPRRRTRDRAE
jgi:chromosome partitioning protein